jgi:hypothetical protein
MTANIALSPCCSNIAPNAANPRWHWTSGATASQTMKGASAAALAFDPIER